jgi:hypothetical protein
VGLTGLSGGEPGRQGHRRLGLPGENWCVATLRYPATPDLLSGPAAHRAAHQSPNDAFGTAAIIRLADYH